MTCFQLLSDFSVVFCMLSSGISDFVVKHEKTWKKCFRQKLYFFQSFLHILCGWAKKTSKTAFLVRKTCKNSILGDNFRLLQLFRNMLNNSQMAGFAYLLTWFAVYFMIFQCACSCLCNGSHWALTLNICENTAFCVDTHTNVGRQVGRNVGMYKPINIQKIYS